MTRRVLEVLRAVGGLLIHGRPDALTVLIGTQFADLPNPHAPGTASLDRRASPQRAAPARPARDHRPDPAGLHPPVLAELATRYHSLRQVTPDDVTEWLDDRPRPSDHLSALRDLFRVLKKQRLVFANPTSRIHRSRPNLPTPRPLSPHALQQIGQAASTDPVLRLVVALIGVHALRPQQVRLLLLADIDLPNQRTDVDGSPRALDAFTVDAIKLYLAYRRRRWPHQQPSPAGVVGQHSRPRPGLRVMALQVVPRPAGHRHPTPPRPHPRSGPRHRRRPPNLAAMFGFAAETGLRYANAIAPQLTTPQP
jgi:hypothetical protein